MISSRDVFTDVSCEAIGLCFSAGIIYFFSEAHEYSKQRWLSKAIKILSFSIFANTHVHELVHDKQQNSWMPRCNTNTVMDDATYIIPNCWVWIQEVHKKRENGRDRWDGRQISLITKYGIMSHI